MDGVLAAGRRALLETKDFSERHERIDRDAACEEALPTDCDRLGDVAGGGARSAA